MLYHVYRHPTLEDPGAQFIHTVRRGETMLSEWGFYCGSSQLYLSLEIMVTNVGSPLLIVAIPISHPVIEGSLRE